MRLTASTPPGRPFKLVAALLAMTSFLVVAASAVGASASIQITAKVQDGDPVALGDRYVDIHWFAQTDAYQPSWDWSGGVVGQTWVGLAPGAGPCPARPADFVSPRTRWVLGSTTAGSVNPDDWGTGTLYYPAPGDKGPWTVCGWAEATDFFPVPGDYNGDGLLDDFPPVAAPANDTWAVDQQSLILRRLRPSPAERRLARPEIRSYLRRTVQAWLKYGQRAIITPTRISQLDPRYAFAAVIGANRSQQVQGGGLIFRFRNARWRPVSRSPGGGPGAWCGLAPDRVIRELVGEAPRCSP